MMRAQFKIGQKMSYMVNESMRYKLWTEVNVQSFEWVFLVSLRSSQIALTEVKNEV